MVWLHRAHPQLGSATKPTATPTAAREVSALPKPSAGTIGNGTHRPSKDSNDEVKPTPLLAIPQHA